MHTAAPTPAHQALVDQLHAVFDRFPGMPQIEKIAMVGQVVGHLIAELPAEAGYSPAAVMQALSLNIASGNAQTSRALAAALQPPGLPS